MYRIICKTDLYHASREAGFNRHTGKKVCQDGFHTLKEANAEIMRYAEEEIGHKMGTWGAICMNLRKRNGGENAGTFSDGFRWFEEDIYSYEVELYTEYEVREAQYGYFTYYEGESIEEAIEEVEDFYSRDGGIEDNTPLEILKDGTSIWSARTDTLDSLSKLRYE